MKRIIKEVDKQMAEQFNSPIGEPVKAKTEGSSSKSKAFRLRS